VGSLKRSFLQGLRRFSHIALAQTAVLLCLSGNISNAYCATNSVNLYGIIDLGLQYNLLKRDPFLNPTASETFFGVASGVQSGSRFGLRATEDIGDGHQFVFVLENGFNALNGLYDQGGRLFGRQSTLGYRNPKLGAVDMGLQINLASRYFLDIDPFAEGFGQANIGASFGNTNTLRYDNLVLYQTPDVNGLTLGAGYSFATGMTAIYAEAGTCKIQGCEVMPATYNFQTNNNLRAVTLGAQYLIDKFKFAAAFDQLFPNVSATNGDTSPTPTTWLVGGSYDFDVIKVSAAYGQTRNGGFVGQPPGTGAAGTTLLTNTTFGAGAIFAQGYSQNSYLIGLNAVIDANNRLLASWQMTRPAGDVPGTPQQIYSAAWLYALSPRTNLYVFASYGINFANIPSAQSTLAGIGIRHMF
jgi:GBP family porin